MFKSSVLLYLFSYVFANNSVCKAISSFLTTISAMMAFNEFFYATVWTVCSIRSYLLIKTAIIKMIFDGVECIAHTLHCIRYLKDQFAENVNSVVIYSTKCYFKPVWFFSSYVEHNTRPFQSYSRYRKKMHWMWRLSLTETDSLPPSPFVVCAINKCIRNDIRVSK